MFDDAFDERGIYDARYLAFLDHVQQLRPKLHRYCARMTGSALDGEDVVQDALFLAYQKLDTYDDGRPLGPWLFRIAHNRCIDLLRRRRVREGAEAGAVGSDVVVEATEPLGPTLGRAVERLVLALPPMERACVLLKDVLDHSLEETATLVGSTIGGVKAALNRGRGKLAGLPTMPSRRRPDAETERLLRLYVERFNRQDWDGLRALIASDARLRVADAYAGRLDASPYFSRYATVPVPWRMAAGSIDDEPAMIILTRHADQWTPRSAVQLTFDGDRVGAISDFWHITWLIEAADDVVLW